MCGIWDTLTRANHTPIFGGFAGVRVEHTVILFSVLLDRCYSDKNISPICTGILIQILIQTGCVYTEAKWISNPDSDHLSHVDCDPDSNRDSGPGARVNAVIDTCICTILPRQIRTKKCYM